MSNNMKNVNSTIEASTNQFNDEFIFYKELRNQLEWLLNNLEDIPSPLCFYGDPGNGKTSFADYLARCVNGDPYYFDMGKHAYSSQSNRECIDNHLIPIASSNSLFERSDAVWNRVIILDEWHNVNKTQQNAYNIPFDKYSRNNNTLFILCVSTTDKKGIDDILTPSIGSRCHCISFNTDESKLDEVKDLVMKQYPELPEDKVVKLLPDMRKVKSAVKLAKVA